MTKDFKMTFSVDGETIGSGFIQVTDGKIFTDAIEEQFYALLRKNEKSLIEKANEEEKSNIVDHLIPQQESKLKEAHAKNYTGTDDDMPDAYEDWLLDLSLDELKKILV